MRSLIATVVVCVATGVAAQTTYAQSQVTAAPANTESVTVTISTAGLGKVTEDVADTIVRLEQLLEQLQQAELSLPAEDIQRLEQLVTASTLLIEAVGENAETISSVIQDAEAPVLDLSAKVFDQAQSTVVTPVIAGVDKAATKVSKTLTYTVIALWILLFVVVMCVAIGAYVLNQRARSLFTGMGKIIDGHVVVPRDTWKLATASLDGKTAKKKTGRAAD